MKHCYQLFFISIVMLSNYCYSQDFTWHKLGNKGIYGADYKTIFLSPDDSIFIQTIGILSKTDKNLSAKRVLNNVDTKVLLPYMPIQLFVSKSGIWFLHNGYFLRSADKGETWTQLNLSKKLAYPVSIFEGKTAGSIRLIAQASPTYGDEVGSYSSNDSGLSWQSDKTFIFDSSLIGERLLKSIQIDSSTFFFGTEKSGAYLGNFDTLFKKIYNGGLIDLAVVKKNNSNTLLLIVTSSGDIKISNDTGISWQSPIGISAGNYKNIYVANSGNIYLTGNNRLYVSKDSGATWTSMINGLNSFSVISMTETSAGKCFLICYTHINTLGSIHLFEYDAGIWVTNDSLFTDNGVNTIFSDRAHNLLCNTRTSSDILKYNYGKAAWEIYPYNYGNYSETTYQSYFITDSTLSVSIDKGKTWMIFSPPHGAGNGYFDANIYGQGIIYGSGYILYTSDFGKNWINLNIGKYAWSPNPFIDKFGNVYAFDYYSPSQCIKYSFSDSTWKPFLVNINNKQIPGNPQIVGHNGILITPVVDNNNATYLYHYYYSKDGGNSWYKSPMHEKMGYLVFERNDTYYFLDTHHFVIRYCKLNGDINTLYESNDSLDNYDIFWFNGKIYRNLRIQRSIGLEEFDLEGIVNFYQQNQEERLIVYPNPANNELDILLQQKTSEVIHTINLFDISGKKILSVNSVDEISYSLNISTLSQGIYILSVESGDKVYTKKVFKL